MTPTERLYEVAMQLAAKKPSEPTSKVSLTWNAKGDVQIEVDVSDADTKAAADRASKTFDVLRAKYPRENGEPSDAEKEAKRLGNAARIQAARARKAEGKS